MKSPFFNFDDAFAPMFSEDVKITFTRNGVEHKQTIKANIFLANTESPLDEGIMDSDIEEILLICNKKDWAFCKTLKRGDSIYRCLRDTNYKVMSVNDDELMGYVITARKV